MPPLARAKVPSRWSGWCPLAGRMAPDLRSARMAHDVSRVDIAAGGNVVDLAARRADVHQLPVTQAGQRAAHSLAIATCLKDIPVLSDQAADMPGRYGRPLRPHCTLDQGHCSASEGVFHPEKVPEDRRACLTDSLHFSYRQLILATSSGPKSPPRSPRRAHPRDSHRALSL